MATNPVPDQPTLDLREQIARIYKLIVAAGRTRQETRYRPFTLVFTGLGAGAAFFAADAAFAKLMLG